MTTIELTGSCELLSVDKAEWDKLKSREQVVADFLAASKRLKEAHGPLLEAEQAYQEARKKLEEWK